MDRDPNPLINTGLAGFAPALWRCALVPLQS